MGTIRINKVSLVLSIIVTFTAVIAMVCNYNIQKNNRQKLAITLRDAIAQNEGSVTPVLDLGQVVNFPWDVLYIFPPYTTHSKINDELGFVWVDSFFTSIPSNDSITLLVFTQNDSVIKYLEFPRGDGDFALARKINYDRSSAIFYIDGEKKMSEFKK